MIPDVSREKLLNALVYFDSQLRNTPEWQGWEAKESQRWAVHYEDRIYPPKKIISIASGTSINEFSGGDESNKYLVSRGFKIVEIRDRTMTIKENLEQILATYLNITNSMRFSSGTQIATAFNKLDSLFSQTENVKKRTTLRVKSSYGQGNWARVPWIAFLDTRETNSTQRGVYVVILFKHDMSGAYITFNQGVTDIRKTNGQKRGAQILQENAKRLRQNCQFLRDAGFALDNLISLSKQAGLGSDYETSTIAHKLYNKGNVPDDSQILDDLEAAFQAYDLYLEGKQKNVTETPTEKIIQKEPELCLIGTSKDLIGEIKTALQTRGGYASWWSFILKEGAQKLLEGPFYLYINAGGGKFPFRFLIEEYTTSIGSDGIECPWPNLAEEKLLGKKSIGDKQSEIFKTWLKVVEAEEIDPPLNTTDFEPYEPLSNNLNLLNQNAFGYAYDPKGAKPEKTASQTKYTIEDALKGLFIDHDRFSELLELFKTKKNIIVQGPPGVGKTFFSKRLAFALIGEQAKNRIGMVQFHQSYSYEDFIQGYRPSGTGFVLKNGLFYEFCKSAAKDPENKYVFIIDEINRGNLSKVFGELMMLIESDKRGTDWAISLTYDDKGSKDFSPKTGRKFYVPDNLYLLGLMNTADRSLAMVDYALRRRFGFVDLRPGFQTQAFKDFLINNGAEGNLVHKIIRRMVAINDQISKDTMNLGPGYCIGHSFFCNIPKGVLPNSSWYNQIINTEIEPLLREYWFDDPSQADTMVKDILLAD